MEERESRRKCRRKGERIEKITETEQSTLLFEMHFFVYGSLLMPGYSTLGVSSGFSCQAIAQWGYAQDAEHRQ